MIWLKRVGWLLLIGAVLLLAFLAVYVSRSHPRLDGELRLAGLGSPVTVQRDGADVTHILARTPRDAWRALGYVHAQERGWQMEFNRRVMRGQLSEVFGAATLETDKLLRALGIMRAAQAQWEGLPADVREALQVYSDGVNAFHAGSTQALPPEFHVLGVEPGRWEPQDSVGWSLMMALDLGGNWGNEFARLSSARVVGTPQLWQLFPPYPGEAPASGVDFAKLYADLGIYRAAAGTKTSVLSPLAPARQSLAVAGPGAMQAWSEAFVRDAGTLEGKGSNNWAVTGGHSKSGKPLVANDPHLGLSAPAIWYFARLQAPGLDVAGATLPGLPFVIIGRTQRVAWGFTNTAPDVQDLYIEQINPADARQYRTPDGWAEFKTRVERIKVRNGADVNLTVRETRHGPVLSDAQSAHGEVLDLRRHVLALRWSALDADNLTLVAGLRSNTARSVDELFEAYAHYHSPTQSAVAADVDGKVGFKVVGRVPLRRSDNDIRGVAPSPGWDARYDWAGWIPYAQTPQDDGARGWVATANQRITPPGYPYFMGQDWNPPDRHDRIEQMLAATPKHDMASMRAAQGDQLSLAALRLLPVLQRTAASHPLAAAAQAQLKGFDSVMRADSAAPLIFSVWADELTRGLIAPRLGQARFDAMYGKRNFRAAVEDIMARDDAFWCGAGGCAAQSAAALARALTRIEQLQGADPAQWRWGKAHPAISAHRPFGNVPVLARFFDVRVPTGGDAATVNVAQYWANDPIAPFANRHAASLRVLYDLSDLENSQFIYQTGQSGLVFSGRYRDMSAQWAAVQYRPLQLKPSKIEHSLTLTP